MARKMGSWVAVGFVLVCLKLLAPNALASTQENQKPTQRPTVVDGGKPVVESRAHRSPAEPPLAETVPMKVHRYAQGLIRRYDLNGDEVLDAEEWRKMRGEAGRVDADEDGAITVEEMAQWIVKYGHNRRIRLATPPIGADAHSEADVGVRAKTGGASAGRTGPSADIMSPDGEDAGIDLAELEQSRRQAKFHVPSKRLPAGLPSWFLVRDDDGDGQLTLSEFAPKPTPADLSEFARYDLNRDGLITAKECARSAKASVKSAKPSAKKAPGQ